MTKQRKHANAIDKLCQLIPDRRTPRINALIRIRRQCVSSIWEKSAHERFWSMA